MALEMVVRESENQISVSTVDYTDSEILSVLEPAVQDWWEGSFGDARAENDSVFTPPQQQAIPLIHQQQNTLIAAPTGSGKTLAAFSSIINDLHHRATTTGLDDSVYCLYISPLKSLANDIHRNLTVPLEGISAIAREQGETPEEIRHAIRHGDTDTATRQDMLNTPPHILNTTPETLAILLNAPRFRATLETVEYVIIDEIHSLADNKRGTHLALSLERLENIVETSPTRIGCSATVEPLGEIARFLVGQQNDQTRPCSIVDARFGRSFDLQLECPTNDLITTDATTARDQLFDRLHRYAQEHSTTLIFTNTRSGAERVLHQLRERYPASYSEENTGCHHGSLSKTMRESVESRLKSGDIDLVTTSTSLELGIDMPTLDLVVQIGSPKSVAGLLQRVGRAGHSPGDTVTGRILTLDRDELIECSVMVKKAVDGFVDRVFIPSNCQDVVAQHIYGMAINSIHRETRVWETIRRAYPYRRYDRQSFDHVLDYLTGSIPGLEEKNVYPKVWRDTNDPPNGEHHHPEFAVGERLIGKRGRLARPIYMQNIGTIPDSFSCNVYLRESDEWIGDLDEEYLDTLDPGDVFVLGGSRYTYRYRRGTNVYVDQTTDRPTVPSWFSERLPLSFDLGREILSFQEMVLERFEAGGEPAVRSWLRSYPIDENAVYALTRMFAEQREYLGEAGVSTPNRLVIEEEHDSEAFRRRFYVHSQYGRRVNDGLSRVVAHRCAEASTANVRVSVADKGFVIEMPLNRNIDVARVLGGIEPDAVRSDLRESLAETDLLKRYFRINATRALMVLKRYKGEEKSAQKQQVSSEMLLGFAEELSDFAVIEETYREIIEDNLHVEGIKTVLEAVQSGSITIESYRVGSPSPLAFGLATLASSDVVLADDETAVLREFHDRVLETIGESGEVA